MDAKLVMGLPQPYICNLNECARILLSTSRTTGTAKKEDRNKNKGERKREVEFLLASSSPTEVDKDYWTPAPR